jgi:ribosomal protein S18 acetylase RimI-like enzyme
MSEIPLALMPPNPRAQIRPVRLADAEPLHFNCWPERPLTAIYRLVLRAQRQARQNSGLGIVMTDASGAVIGYGQFTIWPRCGEISDLVVQEAYRGRGFGTTIVQYLMRAARDMHTDCVEIGAAYSNPRAIALYRRLGFQDSHTISMNLGRGEEQVLYLRLDLRGESA